jgi:hypothetical protein
MYYYVHKRHLVEIHVGANVYGDSQTGCRGEVFFHVT